MGLQRNPWVQASRGSAASTGKSEAKTHQGAIKGDFENIERHLKKSEIGEPGREAREWGEVLGVRGLRPAPRLQDSGWVGRSRGSGRGRMAASRDIPVASSCTSGACSSLLSSQRNQAKEETCWRCVGKGAKGCEHMSTQAGTHTPVHGHVHRATYMPSQTVSHTQTPCPPPLSPTPTLTRPPHTLTLTHSHRCPSLPSPQHPIIMIFPYTTAHFFLKCPLFSTLWHDRRPSSGAVTRYTLGRAR